MLLLMLFLVGSVGKKKASTGGIAQDYRGVPLAASRRGALLHSGLSLLELVISCKSRSGPRKDGGSQREDASKGESVGSIGSASLFTVSDS